MGIRSWFTSYWSQDWPDRRGSLVISRRKARPKHLEEIKRAAAADVARVEEDDKYFGRDAPANQDEGL